MPSTVRETFAVRCPTTVAFDAMADVRNEQKWRDTVTKVELQTPEPIGKGSTFSITDNRDTHIVRITTYERPTALSFDVEGEKWDVAIDYDLTETDGVTTMSGVFVAEGKGFTKFLLPLLVPLIRRGMAKDHRRFARLCEAEVT